MQSSTRKPVFVVHGISQHRLPDLFQVADAVDAVCLGSCRIQRWQEHPRKNGDDRDTVTLKKWIFYGKLWQ